MKLILDVKTSSKDVGTLKISALPSNLPPEEGNIFLKKIVSLATGVHHDNNASLLKLQLSFCFIGQSEFQSQKITKNFTKFPLFVCLCNMVAGSNCVNHISNRFLHICFFKKDLF